MRPGSIYSMHPGFAMEEAAVRNLKERTSRTIEEWVALLHAEGPADEKERRVWLKAEHGITTNYVLWIVERAAGRGPEGYDPDANAEAQYAGKKAHLGPIYESLLKLCLQLGDDVKACPAATIVPLYRKNVFAQIKPTTNSRIDLGLCLRGVAPGGRLIDTGGQATGDRITHRIAITSMDEIDDQVRYWLKRAYDAAA